MRFNIDENSQSSESQNTQTSDASLDSFITNLNNSVTELERMKEEMQNRMKAQFDVVVKELFKVVPKIKAITWTQYSPYFNDGDECVFSVNDVSLLSFVPDYVSSDYDEEDYDDDEDDEDDSEENQESKADQIIVGDYCDRNLDLLTPKELEACNAVRNFISNNEDVMQDLYGNHVGVIVTENGAEVSDYEHD